MSRSKICNRMFRILPYIFLLFLMAVTVTYISMSRNFTMVTDMSTTSFLNDAEIDLEFNLSTPEAIVFMGLSVENYTVQTEDGYILEMFRIPPRKKFQNSSKGAVFLVPGLACDSSMFIDHANFSLAYLAANAGFDIWLANIRGTKYGLKHITFLPDDGKFWDFSWDEIAAYDIPAQLTTAMTVSNVSQIYYVGQSLGNIVGMMLLSSQPHWNQKIKGFLGVRPVTRLIYHTWPMLRQLLWLTKFILEHIDILEIFMLRPTRNIYMKNDETEKLFLKHNLSNCVDPEFIRFGFSIPGYLPLTFLNPRHILYLKHCNAGTSYKAYLHAGQAQIVRELPYYNYGVSGNIAKYNSSTAPFYNFSKITAPVALFTSENDPEANPLAISLLLIDLPNVYSHFIHPYVMFSHMEFQEAYVTTEVKKVVEVLLDMANK